jgi:Xaa-Pro aminopeptidase
MSSTGAISRATTIDPALRARVGQARVAGVRALMKQSGVQSVVVTGSGRHSFLVMNQLWWLTGFRQLGRDAAVVLTEDQEPVLLVEPAWDAARAERESWIDDVRGVASVAAALEALPTVSAVRATVGTGTASPALRSAIAGAPGDVRDLQPQIVELAVAGDELVTASVQRAVEIAEEGWSRIRELARPGMPEYVLAAEADVAMKELGAQDNFLLLSASQHNRAVHAPTGRLLAEGDILLAEISPGVDGHFAQICRSGVVGPVSEERREAYALLSEAFAAGLELCRPGVAVSDLAAAVNRPVVALGFEEFCKPPYMRSRGHSMGLGPLVPADISDRSDVLLAAGMTFVLHPNQYLPTSGYLLCGEQVLIRDGDPRLFSAPARELESIGGGEA